MRPLGMTTLLLCLTGPAGLGQDKTPEVKFVKYNELTDLVVKHRGKVVLVDIWFTT